MSAAQVLAHQKHVVSCERAVISEPTRVKLEAAIAAQQNALRCNRTVFRAGRTVMTPVAPPTPDRDDAGVVDVGGAAGDSAA